MKINEIAKQAHEHAKSRGFFGDTPGLAIGDKIREELGEFDEAFAEGRDCGVCGGLLESVINDLHAWDRTKNGVIEYFETKIKNTTPDELTDILITTLSGMIELGYDPEAHILAKLAYNSVRDDHLEVEDEQI